MKPPRRPTVLIGFAEAFAAIETAWSLQRAGIHVVAFGRAGRRSALTYVRGVEVIPVPPPEDHLDATLRELSGIVASRRLSAVLPLDDAALLLSTRLALGDIPIVGLGLDGPALALDKVAQIRAARAAGLPVPPTEVFETVEDVPRCSDAVMIKPADAVRIEDGRLIRPGGRVCASQQELDGARRTMAAGRVLVQPLLHGRGEGLFGYSTEEGPTAWSAHRRLRMVNPQGSASSACASIPVDPWLQERVQSFIRDAGWRGMFMVEFLRDSGGTPWFMELNGRPWGSLALARRRGFEYPAWTVQEILGEKPSPPLPFDAPDITARHVGREILHLAFVLRGPQSQALVDSWPGRWRTVSDLATVSRRDRLYNADLRQFWVLFVDTWRTVADQVRSARWRTR